MDRLLSMRVFQRVVDEGGFAPAARALDMSPASVTRLVNDLEQHLGARLLHRTTRKQALTDAGAGYLLRVRPILQEIEDAETSVGSSSIELRGTVHVLAPPMLASHFLAPQVNAWRKRYPRVTLDLSVDPFPEAHIEEFDVTFMAVDEGYDANVVARPLAHIDWIVCAAPSYLSRAGTPQSPQDLAGHEYLKFPWQIGRGSGSGLVHLRPLSGPGEAADVEMMVALRSISFEVLHRAALDGAGIAVLSDLLVARHLVNGDLVHLLPGWVNRRSIVYAAVPSRKLIPSRTRALLDFVSELVPIAIPR